MGRLSLIATRTSLFVGPVTGVPSAYSTLGRDSFGSAGGQVIKPGAWMGWVVWDRDEDVAILLGSQMWW